MFGPMALDRRAVMEATVLASALSGAPSTLHALIKRHSVRAAVVYVYDATRRSHARSPGIIRPSGARLPDS